MTVINIIPYRSVSFHTKKFITSRIKCSFFSILIRFCHDLCETPAGVIDIADRIAFIDSFGQAVAGIIVGIGFYRYTVALLDRGTQQMIFFVVTVIDVLAATLFYQISICIVGISNTALR